MAPLAAIFIDANDIFRRVAARLFVHHFQERFALVASFASYAEAAQDPLARSASLVLLGLGSEGLLETASLAELRAGRPDVVIVALAYFDALPYRQLLLLAGADVVIAKEQIAAGLLPAIEHALASRCGPRM